jgi:mono/diheme cytochrome c family protein
MKAALWMGLAALVMMAGCKRDDMADQPRIKPLAASSFFADGASARLPVPHTVDRRGMVNEEDRRLSKTPLSAVSAADWHAATTATRFPFPITRADLLRGQAQFTIYCTPCHGILGDGEGMVPERGFTRPPTYHSDRLRGAPPSYFYNVMTRGIGAMFPYADRVSPEDRWRIAAYIKALQLSQHAGAGPDTRPAASAPAQERGGGR